MLAVLVGVGLVVAGAWLLAGTPVALIVAGVPLIAVGVLVEL